MKKLLLIILGVSFSSIAAPTDAEYDYSGAYFNLGAGWGYISNLPTGTFAGSAAVGYNFNRYFALEAAWAGLPSQQWGSLSNYNLYTLNMKGILPVNDSLNFYGKLGSGVGYSTWSGTQGGTPVVYQNPSSATGVVVQASLGTSLAVSDHISLYLENNSYFPLTKQNGSFATTNATVFGFQYNFSAPRITATTVENNYSLNTPLAAPPTIAPSTAAPSTVEGRGIAATSVVTPTATQQTTAVVTASPRLAKNPEFQSRIKVDDNGRQYVLIKNGETLYRMSVNSGVSQTELRRINQLKSNTLLSGRQFFLN